MFSFSVKFEIGGGDAPKTPTNEQEDRQEESWECVWKCHTASPVHHMAFSPDGTLFATSGKSDRLVKVWYENKHCKYCVEIQKGLALLMDILSFSAVSIENLGAQSVHG